MIHPMTLSSLRFPRGSLNKKSHRTVTVAKACENIGLIKEVVMEMKDRDIAYVRSITVNTPKDPANPEEKKPVVLQVKMHCIEHED